MSAGGILPLFARVPSTSKAKASSPTFNSLAPLFSIRESLRILIIGTVVESIRRLTQHLLSQLYDVASLTATFDEDDPSHEWLMYWLSTQSAWNSARSIEVTTRSLGHRRLPGPIAFPQNLSPRSTSNLSPSPETSLLPAHSTTLSFFYKRTWIRATRFVSTQSSSSPYTTTSASLNLRILTRSRSTLNSILSDAKKVYLEAQTYALSIYNADQSHTWRKTTTRSPRPLSSLILDPGVADRLLNDAESFLSSRQWYATRGIPFRRGYLFHGPPGTGKTSAIHTLAGVLKLDVYVLPISRAGLDDAGLSRLVGDLPARCIALMEDVDAAFHSGVSARPQTSNPSSSAASSIPSSPMLTSLNLNSPTTMMSTTHVSLSGLLNALDGIGAQEGRLLFATTNHYSLLDPALIRPGRMDLHVEFKLASRFQARVLFERFYLPTENGAKEELEEEKDVEPDKVIDSVYSSLSPQQPPNSSLSSSPLSLPLPNLDIDSGDEIIRSFSKCSIQRLARKFAASVPEREYSMASLQEYLMTYRTRPVEAVSEIGALFGRRVDL